VAYKKKPNWLLPLFVLIGIGVGAYTARGPWRVYQEEQTRAKAMSAELKTLKKSRVEHLVEKAKTTNPVKMEEEARKQGYRAQGEQAISGKPK
jgi:hypothetical protein